MADSNSSVRADAQDIAAALDAIRTAVRRNAGYASAAEVPAAGSTSIMASELADLAVVSAHLPVTWSRPVIGRGVALAKRGTRLLLRWYINPIVEQQNAFNEAVARAIATLEERQREIERKLAATDQPE